ncbi:hypothetical protein HYV88_01660 [Candidatus Woesearchaeota archaeon]|nr:hypothetical protein [Candidatus Woesearchaeota archaeon]
MRKINPDSPLSLGALVLPDGAYESLDADLELSKRDIEKYTGEPLTKRQAKSNPIWRTFAGNDQDLLNDYVNAVFSQAKTRFRYDENMGIYVSSPQEQLVLMNLFVVDLLEGGSVAFDRDHLDCDSGRLVGVRP